MSATASPSPVVALSRVFQHVAGRCVLDGVSLTLAAGDGLLLVGPNGAGKTLLTRLILGLDNPSAGRVLLFGEEFARLGGAARRALRQRIGAVLQGGALLEGLTVLENLLLPLRPTRLDRAAMARAARLVLTQLQLDGMENHRPTGLSLGQRRRVELARALIHRPALLVWDGVGDGLDPGAARDIAAVLRQEQEGRGLTIIATDNHVLPPLRADGRVAVLAAGCLVFDGDRAGLATAAAADPALRQLLGERPAEAPA